MRKRMAERFGRKVEHLAPANRDDLTVDAEKLYQSTLIKNESKVTIKE